MPGVPGPGVPGTGLCQACPACVCVCVCVGTLPGVPGTGGLPIVRPAYPMQSVWWEDSWNQPANTDLAKHSVSPEDQLHPRPAAEWGF